MADEKTYTEKEFHKKVAIDLFNLTWELMEKKDRTQEETDGMIHAAHASRYHWGEIGTPVEFERGEWQIARVYSILGRSEPALYHAGRCLQICQGNNIGDFDIAFAYEGMARAHSAAGNKAEAEKYLALGKDAADRIAKKEDRDYFLGELGKVTG
jgi:hypothetical protein